MHDREHPADAKVRRLALVDGRQVGHRDLRHRSITRSPVGATARVSIAERVGEPRPQLTGRRRVAELEHEARGRRASSGSASARAPRRRRPARDRRPRPGAARDPSDRSTGSRGPGRGRRQRHRAPPWRPLGRGRAMLRVAAQGEEHISRTVASTAKAAIHMAVSASPARARALANPGSPITRSRFAGHCTQP